MNTKQLQLVTFEQAKRLKAKGFDWKVYHAYSAAGSKIESCNIDIDTPAEWTARPTVALALKWFRDVMLKNTSLVTFDREICKYRFATYNGIDQVESITIFDFYEAAESALLDELLTLIEKAS